MKRSHSGLEGGGGGELPAGMQRILQEAARGMGLRPDGGAVAAEGPPPDRQQQQLPGGGRSRKDIDPMRLFVSRLRPLADATIRLRAWVVVRAPRGTLLRAQLQAVAQSASGSPCDKPGSFPPSCPPPLVRNPPCCRARPPAVQGLSGAGPHPFPQRSRASPPPSEGGRGGWPPIGGAAGGQPSSTLLEQMARRVLLSSGGQGGAQRSSQGAASGPPNGATAWAPPSDVKDHPEAQSLAAVYPELAAQIQQLSQQLQAVQAQLAMVMPKSEGPGSAAGAASPGPAPSALGGSGLSSGVLGSRDLSLGGPAASPGRATAAPLAARHPPPLSVPSARQAPASKPASAGGFTAEDLLKAFAAGLQQSNGRSAPSKGGVAGLEELVAKATGLDLPARRTPPPPAAPSPPPHAHDLPPAAWDMLQALMKQPGAGSPGRGGAVPARLDAGTPPSSAIEQLSAALRAAGDVAVGTGSRSSRSEASDHSSLPIGDMFAFLTAGVQGSGRRGL